MSRVVTTRRLTAALSGTAIVAAGVTAFATPAMAAAPTITQIAPNKVAAATGNVTVTITGTNFDAAAIGEVDLGADTTNCNNAGTGALKVSFVVVNSTTIVAKTPAAGCAATAGGYTGTGEAVDIYDNTATTRLRLVHFTTGTTKTGLFFLPPPNLATDAAATPAVYLDNSAQLATAAPAAGSKIVQVSSAGGQTVRVNAGTTYATGISATLGGKALSSVVVVAGGAYFTAKTSAMADSAGATVPLVLTYNGVSKSFTTQIVVKNTASVTSVSPKEVAVGSGATLTISGTGFSTTGSEDTVKVCGVTAAVTGTPTKTKLTVALPTVQNVATALGTGNYEGTCNVTVQNTNATTPYAVSLSRSGAAVTVVSQ